MLAAFVFVGVVMFVGGIVVLAAPRRVWWAMSSWRYREPEANEPSENALGLSGAMLVVAGILVAVIPVGLVTQQASNEEQRRDQALVDTAKRVAGYIAGSNNPGVRLPGDAPTFLQKREHIGPRDPVSVEQALNLASVPEWVQASMADNYAQTGHITFTDTRSGEAVCLTMPADWSGDSTVTRGAC